MGEGSRRSFPASQFTNPKPRVKARMLALPGCSIRSLSDAPEHCIGDCVVALRLQRVRGAEHVTRLLVLTELELADEAGDLDLKPHDGREHFADERRCAIAHPPGAG